MKSEPLYSLEEFARLIKVPRSTLYDRHTNGHPLPPKADVKKQVFSAFPRRIVDRYKLSDLRKWHAQLP